MLSADLRALNGDEGGCRFEAGPVVHPEVPARIQAAIAGCKRCCASRGRAVGIGRRSRNVPDRLMRELLSRDDGCSFPGCGTRRFLAAHHVVHWAQGGATELDNLTLLCSFHHKLVHEGGWKVKLTNGLRAVWSRPERGALRAGASWCDFRNQRGPAIDCSSRLLPSTVLRQALKQVLHLLTVIGERLFRMLRLRIAGRRGADWCRRRRSVLTTELRCAAAATISSPR